MIDSSAEEWWEESTVIWEWHWNVTYDCSSPPLPGPSKILCEQLRMSVYPMNLCPRECQTWRYLGDGGVMNYKSRNGKCFYTIPCRSGRLYDQQKWHFYVPMEGRSAKSRAVKLLLWSSCDLDYSGLISPQPWVHGRGNFKHSCRWKNNGIVKSASAACFRSTDKTCWGQAGCPLRGKFWFWYECYTHTLHTFSSCADLMECVVFMDGPRLP